MATGGSEVKLSELGRKRKERPTAGKKNKWNQSGMCVFSAEMEGQLFTAKGSGRTAQKQELLFFHCGRYPVILLVGYVQTAPSWSWLQKLSDELIAKLYQDLALDLHFGGVIATNYSRNTINI